MKAHKKKKTKAAKSGKEKKKNSNEQALKCTKIGFGHFEIISLKDLVLNGLKKQGETLNI